MKLILFIFLFKQRLTGKLYYCQEGEAHHLSSGAAVAPDHTCEDSTLPKAILNHLERFPGTWSVLPWTCLVCDQDNDGMREHCSTLSCPEDKGSRAHALNTVLESIGQELTLINEEDTENSELLSIRFMIELLFSPHNRYNQGLLKEAFIVPVESENPCACMTALGLTDTNLTTDPEEKLALATLLSPHNSPPRSPSSATTSCSQSAGRAPCLCSWRAGCCSTVTKGVEVSG